ncbi:MAG: hypothetical protein HY590_04065 [Candidatus Omnitrophica bacterium]|nr:hypothetical protein [Candidatus Omnitrophota bacterium]
MSPLAKGDVVEHTVLETQKVIVGVGKDRYLCVHVEDVGPDGRVRPNARVAMHRGDHLQKVGYRPDVVEIDLNRLYQKESTTRRTFIHRVMRQEVLAQGLFILAAVLIVLALFSGIDIARKGLDRFVTQKIDEKRKEIYQDYYKGYETLRREKERFQRR